MTLVCFIRYQIDPFQLTEFQQYAKEWGRIIPALRRTPVVTFTSEGTIDIAWGFIGFIVGCVPSLPHAPQERSARPREFRIRTNGALYLTRRADLRRGSGRNVQLAADGLARLSRRIPS